MNVLSLSRFSIMVGACVFLLGCHSAQYFNKTGEGDVDFKKAATINAQLGLAYLKQGNRPRAKKKLLTAFKQQPNSPQVNGALAYYFEQTHELNQARVHYLKAISLAPNEGGPLNNYGAFLCRQKKYEEAIHYFLKAVQDEAYIHTAKAYENAGLCVLNVPDLNKAKSYFSTALKQDPFLKASFYEWIKIEVQLGNNKKALKMLQNRPDLVLNDRLFLSLAKDIALKTKQYQLVAKYEQRIIMMDPQLADNSGANNEHSTLRR